MAAGTSIETLKNDSSAQLREARDELGEEISHVSEEFNPKHLAHVVVERHKGALIAGGLAAGALVSYLVFRPRHPIRQAAFPVQVQQHAPDPESTWTGKMVGGLIKLAAPFLVKALITELTSFRSRRPPVAQAEEFAEAKSQSREL